MAHSFRYKHISPTILELYWPAEINPSTLLEMMGMKTQILSRWKTELWEVSLGYHCLSLHFKAPFYLNDIINKLELMAEEKKNKIPSQRKRWIIPVWYQGKDLELVADHTGLDAKSVISSHQQQTYLLYFYGFMPGFMYLGGLDERLFVPRKKQPDPLIEKGSVAIGGKQTGVYPMDSPGGWNIIGQTPVKLFNVYTVPPLKPQPGDEIKFESINRETYKSIAAQVDQEHYQLHYENI